MLRTKGTLCSKILALVPKSIPPCSTVVSGPKCQGGRLGRRSAGSGDDDQRLLRTRPQTKGSRAAPPTVGSRQTPGGPAQGRPRPAFGLTLGTFPSGTDIAHALPSAPRGPLPPAASRSPLGRAFRGAIEAFREENGGRS